MLGAIEAVEGDREAAVAAFERARPAMDAEIEATGRAHVLALGALAHEDRAGALAQFAAAERVCPPGSGVARSPWHGLYTLLLALDPDVPTTLADELVADAHSLHVATLALVDLARAVHAGRRGDAAEAAALFSSGDTVLAAASWYRNVGRRLVAEAAIADGWGTPAVWLRDALAFFVSAGLDEPARACRSLLRRAGAAVPRAVAAGGSATGWPGWASPAGRPTCWPWWRAASRTRRSRPGCTSRRARSRSTSNGSCSSAGARTGSGWRPSPARGRTRT